MDLKLGVDVAEFIQRLNPFVADVTIEGDENNTADVDGNNNSDNKNNNHALQNT